MVACYQKNGQQNFFFLSIINNEYNLGHVYIPISESQMSAVHNSNCMLLDHIYWNLFAGAYLFVLVFQSVCLVCMKWVKEQENLISVGIYMRLRGKVKVCMGLQATL
jgi:hypothetical protein